MNTIVIKYASSTVYLIKTNSEIELNFKEKKLKLDNTTYDLSTAISVEVLNNDTPRGVSC